MKTKTWKIGEECKGGVITVEIKGKDIVVIGKNWDLSKGSDKNSDQSGAKEFMRQPLHADSKTVRPDLEDFLNYLTTSYHADKVIEWIESQVKLKEPSLW